MVMVELLSRDSVSSGTSSVVEVRLRSCWSVCDAGCLITSLVWLLMLFSLFMLIIETFPFMLLCRVF